MEVTKTYDVADYWRSGTPACNNGGQFWTDGQRIYSYRLLIGETTSSGQKMAMDYTASSPLGFKSMTTSKHVGYARRVADLINNGAEIRKRG